MNKTRTTYISALTRQLDDRVIQNHLSRGQCSKSSAWNNVQTSKHWVTSASQPSVLEGEKPDTQLGHPAMPDALLGQSPLGAVPARVRICDKRWDVASPFLNLSCLLILTLPSTSSSLGSNPFPSLPYCFGNRACLFLANIPRIIIYVHRLLVAD